MRPVPGASPAAAGHSTTPSVGSLRPAMMRNAVDLPQPDGPSKATNSPGRISRSRPASACVPFGNALPTPRKATNGTGCIAAADGWRSVFIEPNLLVHKLQGVGFAIIEVALDHAGAHHLVEKILHARVCHGADPER